MADHVVFVGDAVAAMRVAARAMSSALPQELRLHRLIISGAPLVLVEQPTRAQDRLQAERELCRMSASFFWINCVADERAAEHHALHRVVARGVPANSAAPSAPQEMP